MNSITNAFGIRMGAIIDRYFTESFQVAPRQIDIYLPAELATY